jgi:hypothetical protein
MQRRRTATTGRPWPVGLMLGGLLAIVAVVAFAWSRLGLAYPLCPFKAASGIPCPTCGSTRLADALLRGDLLTAFELNPLVFLALLGLTFWAIGSGTRLALGLPTRHIRFKRWQTRRLWGLLVAVILLGWLHLILQAR